MRWSAPSLFFCLLTPSTTALIAALERAIVFEEAMKRFLAATLGLLFSVRIAAETRPILYDPVSLNIGVNCQWQSRCMSQQHRAMRHALDYVGREKPPQWRVHLCNRNARRAGNRVDWIGFEHCVGNPRLKPVKRTRR